MLDTWIGPAEMEIIVYGVGTSDHVEVIDGIDIDGDLHLGNGYVGCGDGQDRRVRTGRRDDCKEGEEKKKTDRQEISAIRLHGITIHPG
jgi:hypothetical protein